MATILTLDKYIDKYSKEHGKKIREDAKEIRKKEREVKEKKIKPSFEWKNQLWNHWRKSPRDINMIEKREGRSYELSDKQKITLDLLKSERTTKKRKMQIQVLVDEWAIQYYEYQIEIHITKDGREWWHRQDEEYWLGYWPICELERVVNPKTGRLEYVWRKYAFARKLGERQYIRLREKYFNKLRHAVFFRALHIPAFRSQSGGDIKHKGEIIHVDRITRYLEDFYSLEQLLTLNNIIKEVLQTNYPRRGPPIVKMSFKELYQTFMTVRELLPRIKTGSEKLTNLKQLRKDLNTLEALKKKVPSYRNFELPKWWDWNLPKKR
jgi:hypothetical protein